MTIYQLETSDHPLYLVWLDPESLQMEGSSCHASRAHGTFIEVKEKLADALHALRQHAFTTLSETLLLDIVESDVANVFRVRLFVMPHPPEEYTALRHQHRQGPTCR